MNWLSQLFYVDSIPHCMLIISLVVASGLILGRFSLAGIRLGISGVVFSGLIFGHFQLNINNEVLHFLREFGLILFVYAIGLQVGPSFVNSFFRYGLRLNAIAAGVVILGTLITQGIHLWAEIPMPIAVGLFSGATTNTPSLAAAQQAMASVTHINTDMLKMPGLGFGVSYPIGIIGINLTMLLTKWIFKINIKEEAQRFALTHRQQSPIPVCKDLVIENPNLQGLSIEQIPFLSNPGVVVTRILHQHNSEVEIANHDTIINVGDTIRLVGECQQLERLKLVIGHEADIDLKDIAKNLISKRLVVSNKEAINLTIGELCLRFGVSISRIHRPDVEFSPTSAVHVQFGDELNVVGNQVGLEKIEKVLGNSLEELNHPQIIPIFIGISLGVLAGSFPIYLPGMPSAVKLGMAGGPLLIAIILSRIGNIGTMTWHLPKSSNILLKDIGIVLFLACVGLQSGDQFLSTLLAGDGLYWMSYAILITMLPLITAMLIARLFLKLNFLSLCGLLSGSMTYPPALPFAATVNDTLAVSLSYATVYPLVMILRIMAAQLLILFYG